MATKEVKEVKEEMAFIQLTPLDESERQRMYQLDGRNFLVETGKVVKVPVAIAEIMKDCGDITSYTLA